MPFKNCRTSDKIGFAVFLPTIHTILMADQNTEENVPNHQNPSFEAPYPSNKKLRWVKWVFILLFWIFVIAQIFQPDKNNNNGLVDNDISSFISVPDTIHSLLIKACYDCHSNNTDYPWFTNIQPGGWWLASHIEEGKMVLNFNEFVPDSFNQEKRDTVIVQQLTQIRHSIESGSMPLLTYRILHSDARLSDDQKKMIFRWIDSTLHLKQLEH